MRALRGWAGVVAEHSKPSLLMTFIGESPKSCFAIPVTYALFLSFLLSRCHDSRIQLMLSAPLRRFDSLKFAHCYWSAYHKSRLMFNPVMLLHNIRFLGHSIFHSSESPYPHLSSARRRTYTTENAVGSPQENTCSILLSDPKP